MLICLSLFLQEARHESALSTGLLILPMVAIGLTLVIRAERVSG